VAVVQVSSVAQIRATSATVTFAAAPAAGHKIVVFTSLSTTGASTISGYTSRGSQTTPAGGMGEIFDKTAGASEPTSITVSNSSDPRMTVVAVELDTATFDTVSFEASNGLSGLAWPTVNTAGPGTVLAAGGDAGSNSGSANPGFAFPAAWTLEATGHELAGTSGSSVEVWGRNFSSATANAGSDAPNAPASSHYWFATVSYTGGTPTDTGTAAMSARASLTVAGKDTQSHADAMSAQSSQAVAGTATPVDTGAAAMSAQAGMHVQGTTDAIVRSSAQAGMTVGPSVTETPDVAMSAQVGQTIAATAAPGSGAVPMSALAGMGAAGSRPMLLTADLGAIDGTLTLGPITRYITATAVLGDSATLATPGNTGLVAWWTPADRPALVLYDTDGQTYLAHLTLARNVKLQHELSAPGSLSFDLPADDAATDLVTAKTIVKCWLRGHPRIAVQIDESTTETAVEGRAWRSWSLPGALSWLGEIAVLPEYGIGSRTSSTTRTFGVGSKTGHWYYASGDWTRAAGFRYSDDTGLKKGKPKGLSGPNPWWIAKVDPYAHAEPNAAQYFRRPFHLAKGVTAQILATGDDYMTLWLDGEEIFTPDRQQAQSWQYLAQITVALDAGDHILAAKVQNSSVDSAGNPVSFIAALLQTNSSGDPVKGAPLLVTDTWWVVSDPTPGWNRADVLWALHDEALAREVRAAQLLDLGFGTVTDSDSQFWTDVGELTADVGSSMLDVAQQFAETHMDLDVLPGPLRVNGYIRKGSDLSGSVTLQLGKDNGSLMQHTVVRTEPSSNAAIMQLRDGRWVERVDAGSISSYGRSEIGLSLGSTSEDSTADEVADKQFGETAGERFSFTTQLTILDGPQPYVDFDLGDSVSVPDDQGGTVKVRVMAVTVDGSGESVQQWVELVQDPT